MVRNAVRAWLRANRHVTEHESAGTFRGDTADKIIERVARRRDNPQLWRAYETAVRNAALNRLARRSTRGPVRKQKVMPYEADRIVELARQGLPMRAIAKKTGRSIPTCHRVWKETRA